MTADTDTALPARPSYWVYRTRSYYWRNEPVQARLLEPVFDALQRQYAAAGFRSPRQPEPYGFDLRLTYQVNPRHPWPDNYLDSAGFRLYSERLATLMKEFSVRAEYFPVDLVDKQGEPVPGRPYYVFHSLEGVLDAMDPVESEWSGDPDTGVPRLALDLRKFEHRPLFTCALIYVPLMRDDLKQAIKQAGMTGLAFLSPKRFRSGRYGFPPDYDE